MKILPLGNPSAGQSLATPSAHGGRGAAESSGDPPGAARAADLGLIEARGGGARLPGGLGGADRKGPGPGSLAPAPWGGVGSLIPSRVGAGHLVKGFPGGTGAPVMGALGSCGSKLQTFWVWTI